MDSTTATAWLNEALNSDPFDDFLQKVLGHTLLLGKFALWGDQIIRSKNLIADALFWAKALEAKQVTHGILNGANDKVFNFSSNVISQGIPS